MKFALLLVCFAIAVVYVYCETCTVNGDCASTGCASGSHIICQHPEGAGVEPSAGLCTCAQDNLSCTTRDDCLGNSYTCIDDDHKHCYDGLCICSRW